MKKESVLLEVCANSLDSAQEAQLGGADRIELCSALELGGLTPSAATLHLVRQSIDLPIFVLIRPRGGDFCYSPQEWEVIFHDIQWAKKLGADGIVCGALSNTANIDLEKTQQLLEASHPLPLTFHRAFDRCVDPIGALQQLMDLGLSRILSSGQEATALQGRNLLKQMVEQAADQLTILAGAGINSDNAKQLVEETGLREIHFSAKRKVMPAVFGNAQKKNAFSDGTYWLTDAREIKNVRTALMKP